jgi:hypothetical protein
MSTGNAFAVSEAKLYDRRKSRLFLAKATVFGMAAASVATSSRSVST